MKLKDFEMNISIKKLNNLLVANCILVFMPTEIVIIDIVSKMNLE